MHVFSSTGADETADEGEGMTARSSRRAHTFGAPSMITGRFAFTGALVALSAASLSLGCSKQDDAVDLAEFSAFHDPSDAPPKVREAADAVVRIATATAYATGSFISADGMLLTNNHVLGVDVCPREGCYATLTRQHERHKTAMAPLHVFLVPQHVDVGLDVAVLQAFEVDASGKQTTPVASPFLTFAAHDAASLVGTRVHVVGHPEGRLKKWTTGDVVDSSGSWFEATAFSLPGNSGSPILDDDGKIVGLLHRGPIGEDLVTKRGVNVYSIGTASAALMEAMAAPLPAAMRSTQGAFTDDEVALHDTLLLNAHVESVQVGGKPKSVVTSLGEACDRGLARTDYASPEDLADALQPCTDAMLWFECRVDEVDATDAKFSVCPSTATETAAWHARFDGVVDHYRALNGSLSLSAATFAHAALATSKADGIAAGNAKLQALLDQAHPPLDFTLTQYLAAFGIDAYDGTRTIDYLRGWQKVPHYALSITSIVSTALWLNQAHELPGDEAIALMKRLFQDDGVSLGGRLAIEDVLYNSKALD